MAAELAQDCGSWLQRLTDGVEGTRDDTTQFIRRCRQQATRIFGLLSCTRLSEVGTLQPGAQSVPPPAHPAAPQQAGGSARPRPTLTHPAEAGSTRPRPTLTRPEEASSSRPRPTLTRPEEASSSRPRPTPAASQYVVPQYRLDSFVRAMALAEGTSRLCLSARFTFFY